MSGEIIDRAEAPGLRRVAILVWYLQHKGGREAWAAMLETEAEQSQRVERFRSELHRIIGERDDINFRINGGCVEAAVEDLRFAALEGTGPRTSGGMTLVTLLGRCPSCGVETMSEPLLPSLAGLGRMLQKFEPISHHFCYKRK